MLLYGSFQPHSKHNIQGTNFGHSTIPEQEKGFLFPSFSQVQMIALIAAPDAICKTTGIVAARMVEIPAAEIADRCRAKVSPDQRDQSPSEHGTDFGSPSRQRGTWNSVCLEYTRCTDASCLLYQA